MGSLSEFLSNLYTITIIIFSIIIPESVIFIRSIAKSFRSSDSCTITTLQFHVLVEEKHRVIQFRTESRSEPVECAVCSSILEEGEDIRELQCSHLFHKDCIDKWLEHDWATCPLCRRSVLPEGKVVRHRRLPQDYDSGGNEELYFQTSGAGRRGGHLYRFLDF